MSDRWFGRAGAAVAAGLVLLGGATASRAAETRVVPPLATDARYEPMVASYDGPPATGYFQLPDKPVGKGKIDLWLLLRYDEPQDKDGDILSSLAMWMTIDCGRRVGRYQVLLGLDGEEKAVRTEWQDSAERPPNPGSPMETVMRVVCDGQATRYPVVDGLAGVRADAAARKADR